MHTRGLNGADSVHRRDSQAQMRDTTTKRFSSLHFLAAPPFAAQLLMTFAARLEIVWAALCSIRLHTFELQAQAADCSPARQHATARPKRTLFSSPASSSTRTFFNRFVSHAQTKYAHLNEIWARLINRTGERRSCGGARRSGRHARIEHKVQKAGKEAKECSISSEAACQQKCNWRQPLRSDWLH